MNTQEVKNWIELYTAIAEGKTIQMLDVSGRWEDIRMTDYDYLEGHPSDYRIKTKSKIICMTYQKLSDWLRECPEEHREWKYESIGTVNVTFEYEEDEANEKISSGILIRRNHGEWQKPVIEIEE